MNADDLLLALARLPRPKLPPSFAARTTTRATEAGRQARVPAIMIVYWLALAFVAGPYLMTSWLGIAVVIALAGIAAFPSVLLPTGR